MRIAVIGAGRMGAIRSEDLIAGGAEVTIFSRRDLAAQELSQKFKVNPTDFNSLNEELKLEIQLDATSQNDLLKLLLQKGQVTHFVEKIPSVNDIFIKTVTD